MTAVSGEAHTLPPVTLQKRMRTRKRLLCIKLVPGFLVPAAFALDRPTTWMPQTVFRLVIYVRVKVISSKSL